MKKVYEKISFLLHLSLMYFFRLFPIKNNKITVLNMTGKGYGGILKEIISEVYNLEKNIQVIWLLSSDTIEVPGHIQTVKMNSVKAIYEMCTSKIWISNCRHQGWVRKRNGQYYIQTWHGEVCIKKVEKDAIDTLPKSYVKRAVNDSKMIDVIVSGSRWRSENIRSSFWYNGDILEADLYNRSSKIGIDELNNIRKKYNINDTIKIALYVPTFRNNDDISCYNLDYKRVIENLEEVTKEKWVLFVRLHPNHTHLADSIVTDSKTVNVTNYHSVEHLICISSVVITDYSGCMFSAYKEGKILFVYAPDYDSYIKNERGMYFDIKKMPASVAFDNDELSKNIREFNAKEYDEKRIEFVKKLGYYEADGINQLSKIIISKVKGDINK